MVDVLDQSGARKPNLGLSQNPSTGVSTAAIMQPYTELARAIGGLGEAMQEAAAPAAAADGANAVSRDADGNLQVNWKAEFTQNDRAYNAAARQSALAIGKTAVDTEMLKLRNDFDGRPAEFEKAAKEYVKGVGKGGDSLLRPMLQVEAERLAGQYGQGLISAKHDLDLKNAYQSLVDRRKLVADNLEALAAQGGTDTDEFRKAKAEWADIGKQLVGNGKFAYNADKDAFDTARLDNRLMGESFVSTTRRILADRGVVAAREYVSKAFDEPSLPLDAKERRAYRNLATSVVNEQSKELQTAKREVDAEGRTLLQGIKNGVPIEDAAFDEFLTRASAAGAATTVRSLVSARANYQQWEMFKDLPSTERVNFARQAIGGAGAAGLDRLVSAVIGQESSGDPNALSPKGAAGLMQVMPGTARETAAGLGIRDLDGKSDAEVQAWLKANPQRNVEIGTAYLSQNLRRFGGDVPAALVAYNAGPGVAQEWIASGKNDAVLPAETRDYKQKILAKMNMGAAPSGPITFNGRHLTGATTAEQIGSQYLGMSENDPGGRAALKQFLQKFAGTTIDPAVTPWCAAFVNGVMGASGRKGTGSLRALDFLNYGTPTDKPTAGDIVVFDWKDGSGHAGIVQGFEEKNGTRYVRVLGGNQGGLDDAGNKVKGTVSSSLFKLDDVAGYRTPPPAGGGPEWAQPRQFNVAGGGRAFLYPDASMVDDYRKAMASDARRLAPSIEQGFRKGLPPTAEEFSNFIDMVALSGDVKLREETSALVKSLEASKQLDGLPKPLRDAALQKLAQDMSGGSSELQRAMLDNLTESFNARDKAVADDPMGAGPRYGMIGKVEPIDWGNPAAGLAARAKASNDMRASTGSTDTVLPLTKAEVSQVAAQFAQGDGAAASRMLSAMSGGLTAEQFGTVLAQTPIRDALVGMSRSGDPAKMTAAFSALDAEKRRDPAAFTKTFGATVEDRLEEWTARMSMMPAEALAKEVTLTDDPTRAKAREALQAEGAKKVEKVTPNDVAGYFDESVLPFTAPGAPRDVLQAGELKADYQREFARLYAVTGDEGRAKELAVERLKKAWAPSALNNGALMKFAPEKAYPTIGGSHDWLVKQFDQAVRQTVAGMGGRAFEDGGASVLSDPAWVERPGATAMLSAKRMLVPDARTEAEFNSGRPPSYKVTVLAPNGMYVPLQNAQGQEMRFFADADAEMAQRRAAAMTQFEGNQEAFASQERFETDAARRAAGRRSRRQEPR